MAHCIVCHERTAAEKPREQSRLTRQLEAARGPRTGPPLPEGVQVTCLQWFDLSSTLCHHRPSDHGGLVCAVTGPTRAALENAPYGTYASGRNSR